MVHRMDRMEEIHEIALRMEDLAYMAGLKKFDRVRYRIADEEIWFIWEEEQLVIIVEFRDTSNDALRAAIERAVVPVGDPALN